MQLAKVDERQQLNVHVRSWESLYSMMVVTSAVLKGAAS